MATLDDAIELAVWAHKGHVDKAGQPYILHALRVMLAVQGEVAQIAAVLHDVVEDTDVDLFELLETGFAPEVVQAVDALTRRVGEDYFDYVRRAKANPIARQVKWADLTDNLRPAKDDDTEEGDRRRQKYGKALGLLRAA